VASTLTTIRNSLFTQRNDPHDYFYKLHDLNEADPPESELAEAQSSEHRKNNKHHLPFSSNSFTRDSMDPPSAGTQNNPNLGSIGPYSLSTPSPPLTPDETQGPTSTFLQTHASVSSPKHLGDSPSFPNSEHLTRMNTPPDIAIRLETSGRKSPSDSEQSYTKQTSLAVAIVVLLVATGIASITTELAVDAIPALVDSWNISHVFLGFIVLPFVGNAAEHVTAAKMALRNRMVLAKNVAVESATQVVLFITPSLVLFCWLRDRSLSLQFDHFEIGCILITGVVVSIAICRGDSGWKQGVILHAIYLVFALCAIVYRGAS
jgi:Ca2+/Na+ antiporter